MSCAKSDETDHAERDGALSGRRQKRDVPEDRRRLHIGAGERDELSRPEEAEVPVLKRDERGLR